MTVFAIPAIRKDVKADIATISQLIAQNLAEINRLKAQLDNLNKTYDAQMTTDAQTAINLQGALASGQAALGGITAPRIVSPPAAISLPYVAITPAFYMIANSQVTYQAYVRQQVATEVKGGMIGIQAMINFLIQHIVNATWPAVQAYLKQKAAYDAYVQSYATYQAQYAAVNALV